MFRIHPESGHQIARLTCSMCKQVFQNRAKLIEHKIICDGKSDGAGTADENVEMAKKVRNLNRLKLWNCKAQLDWDWMYNFIFR